MRVVVLTPYLAGQAFEPETIRNMSAAFVAVCDALGPDAYAKEYAPKARTSINSHGGRFLAIGGAAAGKVTAFEGEAPKRVVLLQWDGMDKIEAWRNDPEYKELRKLGDKYAKFHSYAVEGMPQ